MENEYGITVANKYALFLNEDEDSFDILKINQDSKTTKKADKTKKNAGKEKEVKPSSNKQSGTSIAGQDKKVDQFSSPTVNNEPVQKSGSVPVQVNTQSQEGRLESGKVNKPQRERPKPRSNVNRESSDQHGDENKNTEPNHDNRPPRIRARDAAGSDGYQRRERRGGGYGENRQFRPETEGGAGENTERQNSVGFFERRDRRPPRNGFSDQTAVADGETSEQTNRQGERGDRDGFGGRSYPRRGGFGYRGRGRPDRNHFAERTDAERVGTGFDDNQSRPEERVNRDGFNDNDGGKFMERPERDGFGGPRRDSRGRRGGFGRGRGGYDRPPRRDNQRFGDRRQRPRDTDGEVTSEEQKTESADGEPKLHPEKLQEDAAGGSWAEQIDAADQEAKKDSLNAEEEAGDDNGEGEPKVMTLDEWKAREDNKRIKAEFNIRKPGEGYNTDPQWKKMFVLSKKERPEDHDEEEEQEEEEHHTKPKNVLPIEIHFADDSMRGGRGGGGGGRRGGMSGPRGRGGRSSGRWESDEYGGEGRGSNQGGRGNYNENRTYARGRGGSGGGRRERAPNFSDESDFPSLGSSAQP